MKTLTRETYQIIKLNIRQVLLFELLYRLITGPFYLNLVNEGLKFALRQAGYSYLTTGNFGSFLLKPWTILCILAIGIIGLILLAVELGVLITAFQGAAYYRKMNLGEILFGGLQKIWDECVKRNWKLLIVAMVDYGLTQLFLVYRLLGHVKPINFVLTGMMEEPLARAALMVVLIMFFMIGIPGLFVFHGCMIEQKSFRDSFRRSIGLLKKHKMRSVCVLLAYNGVLIGIWVLLYLICVLLAAVFVVLFTDKNLALALLLSSCDKIELTLIFLASIMTVVVNVAVVTVQYYQYGNQLDHDGKWDFSYPKQGGWSRRMVTGVICAASVLSIYYIYDIVQNGSVITEGVISEIQITAHRGSSVTAPENTMASLIAAVEELADYAEIDVQETADGMVVLGHDNNLKRVAGVNKSIKSMTYEELKLLDVGLWFSLDFMGERIPTLDEVMEYSKGKIKLNIEIKNVGKNSSMPEKVLEMIQEHEMQEQCVVTSTSLPYLIRIKEAAPDIRTGYIVSAAYGNYYSHDSIDFISLRSSFVNEKLIASAHEQGKTIHAWTVNSKSEMERMKMLGVDNIITDYPVLAREIVYRERTTETLLEYIRLVLKA